jgi:glycerol 3-phosphatase-2
MKLVDLFNGFLIDMDGVVYVGGNPIKGSADTIKYLRENGKTVLFLTNDPRRSRSEYADKLRNIGIEANLNDVVTSGMAIAYHIIEECKNLENMKAYVIGSDALRDQIKETGLKIVDGEEAKKADFVILGSHPDFHYNEMKIATLALRNGADFYATNRDPAYPSEEGHIPATGAILASVEVASGKKAKVAGKPENMIFEVALEKVNKDKIVMIGDRLDTDILGGKNAGLSTILVLSGSTKKEDLEDSEIKPDYVINDLRDILKDIPTK